LELFKEKHLASANHFELIRNLFNKSQLDDVTSFDIYIILPNGKFTFLSSAPLESTLEIVTSGYYLGEYMLNPYYYRKYKNYFHNDIEMDKLHQNLYDIRASHAYFQCYVLFRQCLDCTVIAACNSDHRIKRHIEFYQRTVDQFELLIHDFISQTINVYLQYLPELEHSIFASNNHFRRQIILSSKPDAITKLSAREHSVLYWTNQGETANQIAARLSISVHTLNTYKQRIIKKLNASNVVHAIAIARKDGFI